MRKGTIDDLFDDEAPSATPVTGKELETPVEPDGGEALEEVIQEAEDERKAKRPVKPHDVRRVLTRAEWRDVEDYYQQAVQSIVIPDEPETRDLLQISAELDRVYTDAKFDAAFISRRLKTAQRQLGDARKTVYNQIKDAARNDKERDALGTEWLEQNSLPGYSVPIMEYVDEFVERDEFMDAVVSILKSKSDRLIILASALKLELNLIR